VIHIANAIRARQIDIGIGGGVESMSMGDMMSQVDPNILSPLVFEHERAQKCMMPMGLTSEEVAEKFGVTREK
jgi:acetyl-CoA acyltransferase 1